MFTSLKPTLLHKLFRQIQLNTVCLNATDPYHVISTAFDHIHNVQILRHKSKKTQNPATSESHSEKTTWDEQVVDKHTKVMQVSVKSMRIDGLLKSGLGIARNKIETLFYESKIRVNGQKLLKKSELAKEGDEIDIMRGVSVNSPNFLTVSRLEVLNINDKGETITVKVRRCKSLTVEHYEDAKSTQ